MFKKIINLLNHQRFLLYAKNTSWLMAEQFLRIISGLFVGVWVARYLGPEKFGIFSYALAITAIFGSVAKLGLDGLVVRGLCEQPEKRDAYLGTAYWLKFFGSIFVMLVAVIILPFTDNNNETNLYIFIILIGLAFQSFEVIEFYFQSRVLAKFISLCKISQLVISISIKIYLILLGAELLWFVWVSVFDAVTLAICYMVAYRLNVGFGFYKEFDFVLAKKLLNSSWPLILTSLMVMIYARIDQIMINYFVSSYDVGLYSAAIKLTEAWLFFPVVVSSSLFPAILSSKKLSIVLYEKRLLMLYTLFVSVGVLFAFICTFFSEEMVNIFLGKSYIEASSVFAIRSWETVLAALGVGCSQWVLAENLQRKNTLVILMGMLANIVLNCILIPVYLINGAAISGLISIFLTIFVFPIFFRDLRKNLKIRVKALLLLELIYFMRRAFKL